MKTKLKFDYNSFKLEFDVNSDCYRLSGTCIGNDSTQYHWTVNWYRAAVEERLTNHPNTAFEYFSNLLIQQLEERFRKQGWDV